MKLIVTASLARYCGAMIVMMIVVTKLPKTVVPISYSIELRPDAESLTLGGVEAIERRGIFSIIAHEMAHQWIGDHVIMAWWENLWLNEGSATSAEQFAMPLEALPCTGIPDSHGNPEFPT